MEEIATVGLELGRNVVQVRAVDAGGGVILRRQVRRGQLLRFFSRLCPCLIGMEACAGAPCRARELEGSGHAVRLMPPSCVKPFVKRGKTDAADAEAICTAVTQPTMRFVPVKTGGRQAVLMQHRTRDFLVRQLARLANAIRAHPGESGIVAPMGVHDMGRLVAAAGAAALQPELRAPPALLAGRFRDTKARIDAMTADIKAAAKADGTARRRQTMPGIGPTPASVPAAAITEVSALRTARDLPTSLGLTPKTHSSGGKDRLGSVSKMGNRHIRRPPYPGASCQRQAPGVSG